MLSRCTFRVLPLISLCARSFPRNPSVNFFAASTRTASFPRSNTMAPVPAAADDEFGDPSLFADFDVDQAVSTTQRHDLQLEEEVVSSKATATTSNKRLKTTKANTDEAALQETLQQVFGYPAFRPGQVSVIQAMLEQRDTAVFWATGKGKSLCYQIPALHQDQVAIVVSPLISLMQDQVHKLNGLSAKPVSTFLGSAQMDPMEEQKALTGQYNLVYVTPEKMVSSGFVDQLVRLHSTKKPIALIAIDEAHCVSEWGHDFRPDFRLLGQTIRDHAVLGKIPILALTATAVPRVQQDIVRSLKLRNPLQAQQSFDRSNLRIKISKKAPGGVASAFKKLVDRWNRPDVQVSKETTIVYAPTRAEVENIALFLESNVQSPLIRIQPYHAGMGSEERGTTHTNFLTGQTTVIVATVAFGMGIDKPDIRRVVHYGAPKTLEEYYQQIGRAGRDGRTAECIMTMSEADFDRYQSDFYLGKLTGQALQATKESMAAFRNFSLDVETCRRKALLDYFSQESPFGQRCGTCDTCLNAATYGADAQRDFAPLGARVVLRAVSNLSEQGMTNVLKVIGGNEVESYRYKRGKPATAVQQEVAAETEKLSKKYPQQYYRDLVATLAQKGYLAESSLSATVNGFQRSWTAYSITQKGLAALEGSGPIPLPVPEGVREVERKQEERRQRILAELEQNGVPRDKLPQEEVEKGEGKTIQAFSVLHRYKESLRRADNHQRVAQLDSLQAAIEKWRSETAIKFRMAPANVLEESTLVGLVYAVGSSPGGVKMDESSLRSLGVRVRDLDGLVQVLHAWSSEVSPGPSPGSATTGTQDGRLVFPAGIFQPEGKWEHAVYKPIKKTGKASWESSYNRFSMGESPPAIAASPENGRIIQVATVVGHVLEGLVHGRAVDLNRLAQFLPPPSQSEFEQLSAAEIKSGMDVAGDPDVSGRNGNKFTMTDLLRPIVGDQLCEKSYKERSEAEHKMMSEWFDRLKYYMALRRAGYKPTFS